MPDKNLTDDFVQWVNEELKAHADDVKAELAEVEPKKSLAITCKLKLKNIGAGIFRPFYSLSIPRAAVKSEAEPDQQLNLPGM